MTLEGGNDAQDRTGSSGTGNRVGDGSTGAGSPARVPAGPWADGVLSQALDVVAKARLEQAWMDEGQ
jgi:hypothetical protein